MIRKRKISSSIATIGWLAIGLPLFLLTSCISQRGVSHYMPNEAYMMNLDDKGELKVAGSYYQGSDEVTDRQLRQSNVQIAYSPYKHVGLIGSIYNINESEKDSPFKAENNHYELAIGYYRKNNSPKNINKSAYLHDLYLGLGRGNSFIKPSLRTETRTIHQRFFLHYGFHCSFSEIFRIGGGIRYVFLHFDKLSIQGNSGSYNDYSLRNISEDSNKGFAEISLQMQAGLKDIKVFYTLTSIIRGNKLLKTTTFFDDSIMNLGLVFDVHRLWKKRNPKKGSSEL